MQTVEDSIPIFEKWDDLNLKTELLRGIYSYGFENPSPIQKIAIHPIIKGGDVIAQAQSGTGKTGTFSIGILNSIDLSDAVAAPQALILAPTHELAKQISSVITNIGSCMKGLVIKTLVGGSSMEEDKRDIQENPPHIIVGTPGRVQDMLNRRFIRADNIRIFALDEADEMLSFGLKTQIYNIFQFLNENVQVILFSATLPPEILAITEKFTRSPTKITMLAEKLSLECIDQYYIPLENDMHKYECLKDIFSSISVSQCIIYCNSVGRVVDLYNSMRSDGFPVCCIHSNMDKTQREAAFMSFRNGTYRVLISSNITARGIDIQQVSTVINFDISQCVHTYLHRIGRGGRWGKKGLAINFVTRRDVRKMREIETHYKIQIREFTKAALSSM